MKSTVMCALLLVSGSAAAMVQKNVHEKQQTRALLNLRQVLTAGRYVYGEHLAIHADAKQRSRAILYSLESEDRQLLAISLNQWHDLLGLAVGCYQAHTTSKVDYDSYNSLLAIFLDSRQSFKRWIDFIATDKELSAASWHAFREAFHCKIEEARKDHGTALRAQDLFERGIKMHVKLPVETALTAWCVSLPEPK